MRSTTVTTLVVTAVCCAAPLSGQRFSPPRNAMDSALVEETARAKIDYARAYSAARRKDPSGLATLFRATIVTDGVGAEQHAEILWEQLRNWGDAAFSRALRQQPDPVRTRVRCDLDHNACMDWARRYPLTAALARQDPHCVCN